MSIFSLQEVYALQVKNAETNTTDYWPELEVPSLVTEKYSYGYFGGGGTPPPTPWPFGGSEFTQQVNTITRFDFSTETATDLSSGLLQARQEHGATSSSSHGYFGSGYQYPGTFVATTNKLDFVNEVVSSPGSNIPSRNLYATSSSNTYGYYSGGRLPKASPTALGTSFRIDFSTDGVSSSGGLPTAKSDFIGTQSSNYGYFAGGQVPSSPQWVYTSVISRLDFSTGSIGDLSARLSQAKGFLGAVSSDLYAYFAAGYDGVTSYSTIDKLDFSSDTIISRFLTTQGQFMDCASLRSDSYGYFRNGTFLQKLNFQTETSSNIPNTFINDVIELQNSVQPKTSIVRRIQSAKTHGYFCGGDNPTPDTGSPIKSNETNKLDFSTNTLSSRRVLVDERSNSKFVSSNYYAYLAGSNLNYTNRLDFSTDVDYAIEPNITSNFFSGAVSSNSYGYFVNGTDEKFFITSLDIKSAISRIDFSNEVQSSPGSTIPSRAAVGSASNNFYGYFVGGLTPTRISTISRLDFSVESFSTRNPFGIPSIAYTEAASNTSYSYFAGGATTTTTEVSTVYRLDFSTETVSNPGKNLPNARVRSAAVASNSYAYFAGGSYDQVLDTSNASDYTSFISRLDFSTEVVDNISNLPVGRDFVAGTANSN